MHTFVPFYLFLVCSLLSDSPKCCWMYSFNSLRQIIVIPLHFTKNGRFSSFFSLMRGCNVKNGKTKVKNQKLKCSYCTYSAELFKMVFDSIEFFEIFRHHLKFEGYLAVADSTHFLVFHFCLTFFAKIWFIKQTSIWEYNQPWKTEIL